MPHHRGTALPAAGGALRASMMPPQAGGRRVGGQVGRRTAVCVRVRVRVRASARSMLQGILGLYCNPYN